MRSGKRIEVKKIGSWEKTEDLYAYGVWEDGKQEITYFRNLEVYQYVFGAFSLFS